MHDKKRVTYLFFLSLDMLRQSGADTLPQLCIQYKLETPVVTTQETALLRILQDLPGDGHTLDVSEILTNRLDV